MTVDNVVKVIESDNCGLDMSSYEGLNTSAMNVVGGDVSGYVKDDYVCVNDGDIVLSSDHANNCEDGAVDVVKLSVEVCDNDDNSDVETDRLEDGVKLDKVETEIEDGVNEEYGNGDIVEVENVDSFSNDEGGVDVGTWVSVVKESSDRDLNVDDVKEGSVVEPVVDEVKVSSDPNPVVDNEVKVDELGFETGDNRNVDDSSKDGVFYSYKVAEVDTKDTTAVITIPDIPEDSRIKEAEFDDIDDAAIDGIDSRSSDIEENHEDSVLGAQKSSEVVTKDSVPDALKPEVEMQINGAIVEVPENESETEQNVSPVENETEIQENGPERLEDQVGKTELTENNGDHEAGIPVSELQSIDSMAMDPKPLEIGVSVQFVDNGHTEEHLLGGDLKASLPLDDGRLPLADATSRHQSSDCQQQNLLPVNVENGNQDLIDVAAGEKQEYVALMTTKCELEQGEIGEILADQIGPDLSLEQEETQYLQSFPRNSEGEQTPYNLESSGMENPVLYSLSQFDENKMELTSGVEENSEALNADMQVDTTHKSGIESLPERVDGDRESEVMAETRRSLETSPKKGVLQDQIAQHIGSFDIVDKNFSTESYSTENTLSKVQSPGNSVMESCQNDLSGSHARDDVSEDKVAPAINQSSDNDGSCVISEDKYSCLDSSELSAPCDSDILDERGVVDVSSVDDTCSQTNLESSNHPIPNPAYATKSGTKIVDDEIKGVSDGNFRPKISFGSFECNSPFSHNYTNNNLQSDVRNKSTGVHSRNSASKLYSANGAGFLNSQANGDHFSGLIHDTAFAQVAPHQRQQLSPNPQRLQDVQQALNQRDQTGEQLKALKKELNAPRDNYSKANEQVRAEPKKHGAESALLNDLKHQLVSVDHISQSTDAHSQKPKKQLNVKAAPFYMPKNDSRVAYNFAAASKNDTHERHRANQVEQVSKMWNKNDVSRKEFIQCNTRHMPYKSGTNGTRLGNNEVPSFSGNSSENNVYSSAKVNSSTSVLTVQRDPPVEAKVTGDKSSKKVEKKASPTAKKEDILKSSLFKSSSTIVIEEVKEEPELTKEEPKLTTEEPKLTKEEEELAKKTEQLRREEEAARLREQRKLEEKAKAEEALERKRRNALKAQARAEFKARKEAEEREKEREKRAKKKQNNIDTAENEPGQPSEPSSELVKDPKLAEKSAAVAKRPQKASLHTKQLKTTKPIPAAIRNKGKRRFLRDWPYILIILLAIGLFYLGNFERFHISGLLRQ